MDINTRAYEAYARLIKGYNSNNIALGYDHESNKLFVNGAISLAYVSAPNPFLAGSKEGHLYYRMRYCYGMWQRGGIDAKVNRRRMLDAAAKQASMNLPNPFVLVEDTEPHPLCEVLSLEALAEQEYEHTVAEDIDSGTYVPVEEPMHIMGVIPVEDGE